MALRTLPQHLVLPPPIGKNIKKLYIHFIAKIKVSSWRYQIMTVNLLDLVSNLAHRMLGHNILSHLIASSYAINLTTFVPLSTYSKCVGNALPLCCFCYGSMWCNKASSNRYNLLSNYHFTLWNSCVFHSVRKIQWNYFILHIQQATVKPYT